MLNKNMNDLIICTVPYLETYLPPAAPAILKGHLETCGYTVAAVDFNISLTEMGFDLATYNDLVVFFSDSSAIVSDNIKSLTDKIFTNWLNKLQEMPTRMLGISVFSYNSRKATELFVKFLKEKKYPAKIVLGGQGVDAEWAQKVEDNINYWISGEGEIALHELLKGNDKYPGINIPKEGYNPNIQIDDLDQLGPANYSDYDLSKYVFYNQSTVQITGSRGCVRKCTFCDINQKWPKFRWRSGKSIASEIIKIHKETKVSNFFFTDSLINGNMKSFIEMCEILSDYRKNYAPDITWGGQFIVRKIKSLPSNYFHLLAESGAYNLTIGVETGSDRVREHLKKGFTNEDLDYHMEQFNNLGITCGFLMLIGYPTETEEDFEDTLKMLKKYQGYAANGIILGITLGSTLTINKGIPLVEMYKDILFSIPNGEENKVGTVHWVPKEPNASLTLIERIRRRLVVDVVARAWGWNLSSADRELRSLLHLYENENSTDA